jgi:iron complex outermembrane receptor protein
MFIKRNRRLLALVPLAASAILFVGTGAKAQTPPSTDAAAPQGGTLEKITVTGTLIPRVGDGPQPVETLGQDFIEKQADQSLDQVLNRLTSGISQQNATTFAGNSNSPAGSAFGLHGLPAGDTLTLVDGYRFPNYPIPINSVQSYVDINSIPLAAVDHIDVLKIGGGATYGSDAIAGTVNIITKDNYNGVDLKNYYGISQRGDYEQEHFQFTAGIANKDFLGGKLSITTFFDYYSQSPIESVDRWYAFGDRHKLATNYPNQPVAFFPAAGSYTGVTTSNTYQVKNGTTGPNITAADFLINPAATFNTFNPIDEQLAARENNYGGGLNLNYQATDWLKFYDKFFITRKEETSITPNQGFSAGDGIVIPANNPFNPFHEDLIPNGQLGREFGPWNSDVIVRTLRNIVGLNIQLPHDWYIDANYLYGESDSTQTVQNALNVQRLQQAINGTLPGMVGTFFNPFTDGNVSGHPNSAFYRALKTEQFQNNRTDISQFTVRSGGTLYELPSGPISVAGGLEYRSESLIQSNDFNSEFSNIASADFAGHLLSAHRYIYSAYGELDIPIFGEKFSFPGMRNLDISLQDRWDQYTVFGDAVKPTFSIRYKPFDDLTFKAIYAEGFVAPSLGQLFASPLQFQTTIFDPKLNQTYNVLLQNGGNQHLKPQSSYEQLVEMVWEPGSKDENSWWHWAKGFTFDIDWYQIAIRDQISTIQAQTLVGAPGAFPGTVIRNGAGAIQEVIANYQNVGSTLTSGIDVGAEYTTKEYAWGALDFDIRASYIYKLSAKRLEGNADGTAGFQVLQEDDSFGVPDLRLVASLFYSKTLFGTDTFKTGLTVNYTDSEHDGLDNFKGTLPAVDAGLNPPGFVHLVGSWTTLDYQVAYTFGPKAEVTPQTPQPGYSKDGKRVLGEKAISPKPEGKSWGLRNLLDNTTLTFGINNIGDVRPPLSVQGGTFFQGFDTLAANAIQRYFYFQIEKKF